MNDSDARSDRTNPSNRSRKPDLLTAGAVTLAWIFAIEQVAIFVGVLTGLLDLDQDFLPIATGTAVVLLPLYVVSCTWLTRARRIAKAENPGHPHKHGPAWIWLSWIVPVVNVWFPHRVVLDIRAATDRKLPGDLSGWWLLWLLYYLGTWLANRTDIPDGLTMPLLAVATLGLCAALVPWSRTIRDITEAQALRQADRNPGDIVGPDAESAQ